jgi:phosphoenolpyruvate-protein phosphotransferase (PTS system enzyme I)
MYLGTAASPGIAMGRALIVKNESLDVARRPIESPDVEMTRFRNAIAKSKRDLEFVLDSALKNLGKDKAEIFEAHLLILEDPEMIEQTEQLVRSEGINAESAYQQVTAIFIKTMESMNNEYMRERAADVRDVSQRILRALLGQEYVDLANLPDETILVAQDLTPSDTAVMNKNAVRGFITDIGGRTSHTAIIARTLEIPAVVGMRDLSKRIANGDFLVVNGDSGEVFVNPDETTLQNLKSIQCEQLAVKRSLEEFRGKPSRTKDGHPVELAANIGTPKDIEVLLKSDAEGVGLYRTEFVFMNRDSMPTEQEQFEAYKAVLQAMGKKPVIIRTLDIGGDKSLPYLKLEQELNPFLGYRAIRICLDQIDVFKTQLRALLKASVHGNLKIMFPMISSLEELTQSKAILEEVKSELTNAKIGFAAGIQVGIMIEVPSAALISDMLAKHVDFFSIGTNDLIQYMCAVDRMNEKIHHLYNPYNPGVLRMIKHVIDSAHKAGIWCGMCGEVAGDPALVPLLVGMGLDEFSMSPGSILPIRKIINSLNKKNCEELWTAVSQMPTASEIQNYLR